jgi:hypothetical protein
MHVNVLSTGVDAAMGRAVAVAPLARGPKDDDVMLSDAVTGVVRLLQARMRWPGAAQVAMATTTVPNVEEPQSALLGVLKQLFIGTDERYVPLVTCIIRFPPLNIAGCYYSY